MLFFMARSGIAGGEKEPGASIQKIAALIEKGDAAAAANLAKALAKNTDLEDVMNVFKPRKKKGLGVGDKAGAVIPDGIEQQLLKLGRDELSRANLDKEAAALQHMGYNTAAVAEFALAKPPEKASGKKSAKEWTTYAKEMRKASIEFVEAVKSKSPTAVHKAAEKLNTACSSCHSDFRD